MGVFLSILKIIGIILLVILAAVAVLIMLLLFTPFIYKAEIEKNGELKAEGGLKWLFGVLHFSFTLIDMKFDWDLKIIGITLKDLLTGNKKKKERKLKKPKKQPTIMPGEKADKAVVKEARAAVKAEIKQQKKPDAGEKDIFEDEDIRPPGIIAKIKQKLIRLYDAIKTALKYKEAFDAVKGYIFRLAKHIRPRRLSGTLTYGFEDPSLTGKSLAVISIFYPVLPKDLEITPVFDEQVFECDVTVKGRFFLIILLVYGLKIYFNDKVKTAMGRGKGGK